MAKIYFPSLESLLDDFMAVLRRFPLELVFALAGTCAAIQSTLPGHEHTDTAWIRVIMCGNLGLVFSLSASTFATSLRTKAIVTWLLRALVLGLAVFYFFRLPAILRDEDIYRFFLFAAAGHVLVSVAPFWERGNIGSFWFYNKTLFLRFLTAVLYSAVLFAGLSIALLALDELFGVTIEGEVYFRLWMVIAGLFNTLMFLAGVPVQPLEKKTEEAYPKALKVFTQYVLIPLVSIYVLILLAYELKIIVQWDLPRGWVSNLIIAFAVFGVLSLLLVFPVRNSSENKWITWYGKTFHWILLPLVGLLFLAIGKRISEYGFTEERFIVLITGVWLLFTAVYFLSGRRDNIKMIPASLIIFILFTLTLAFPVSADSQMQRLFAVFERNNMLETGESGTSDTVRVVPAQKQPSEEDRKEITSIVTYLYQMHGLEPFRGHFTGLSEEKLELYAYNFTDNLLKSLQVAPAYRWDTFPGLDGIRFFNVSLKSDTAIPITGFDFQLNKELPGRRDEFHAGDHSITEELLPKEMSAALVIDKVDTLRFDLEPLINTLLQEYIKTQRGASSINPEEASLEKETDRYKVRLYLLSVSGHVNEQGVIDTTSSLNIQTGYLLKFKN
ncbi:uncharacterized protein DUF4153 [Anseongella ginsenosidimutans]|uniref:Uncharacterized protein DUF4153 n=1 Tax=Anseongella ginsenosidimutans TaxID=496056 RepID=A0A4R3KKT8_9SPHI|nr:DUF4153 domain-containing protein [Anseongella ginsenosidimutans]QEC51485.1 DUF4153 domain-containing protein [Anseongella ginsenosidimutans]TCS84337.1 uncharacterized protein DUF4153 [Anseongella ginsenosidimutans]